MTEPPPPLSTTESNEPSACTVCGVRMAEPGYSILLCVTCRDRFASRPFPLSIKISALLILIALVFAVKRFDPSIRAGVAFTRGQRAERKGDYARAVQHYQAVVAIFPDSTQALVRLAKCYCGTGQIDEAADCLIRLEGRRISRDLAPDYERALRDVKGELRLRQEGDSNGRFR